MIADSSSTGPTRDFISKLPSELLFAIFDLVGCPANEQSFPLSKRLLPYYLRNLYRSVDIRNLHQFSLFQRSITQNPSLQALVQHISIASIDFTMSSACPESLLASLPNLVHLECRYDLVTRIPPTSRLQHISLDFGNRFDPSSLDQLLLFSSLNHLEIRIQDYEHDSPLTSPQLPQVVSLHLAGQWFWEEGASALIKLFPNVVHLKLTNEDEQVDPDFRPVLTSILPISHQIKSLILDRPVVDWDEWAAPIDDLLPAFTNLEHLSLAEGTNSYNVVQNLRHLVSLQTLRLGPGYHIIPGDLIQLVEGEYKLMNLSKMVLDCTVGSIGRRLDVDDDVEQGGLHGMECEGWSLPMPNHYTIDDYGANELIEACQRNNIELSGTTIDGLPVIPAWHLEIANREVLYIYQNPESIQFLIFKVLIENYPSFERLPKVDWTMLDETCLIRVKTDLPEEGWFALSLESEKVKRYPELEEYSREKEVDYAGDQSEEQSSEEGSDE